MAERLHRIGSSFTLHYAARSRGRAAFLDRIAGSAFSRNVHLHFDDGPAEQRLSLPSLFAASAPRTDDHLYVCGPAAFMEAALSAARAAGWLPSQLHVEYFQAPVPASETGGGPGAFEVMLASSGRIVQVPTGQSAAEALHDAGIFVPVSCAQGICGTCLVRVLEGEPDHRDLFMTDEEHARNDCFTPCCSRARTPRLTLDL
jgi:vanillate O-demethylase ferredoxin subunit